MLQIVSKLGGPIKLAKHLGVKSQAVSQWQAVPAERVIAIAAFSDWAVTPHQIRPDLYPHPDDGLPTHHRCLQRLAG